MILGRMGSRRRRAHLVVIVFVHVFTPVEVPRPFVFMRVAILSEDGSGDVSVDDKAMEITRLTYWYRPMISLISPEENS